MLDGLWFDGCNILDSVAVVGLSVRGVWWRRGVISSHSMEMNMVAIVFIG